MDPHYEQRLLDEVIYLHSLWHLGPPSRSLPHTNLQPSSSVQFKKHKTTPKFNARKPKKVGSFSGTEWPVKPLPEAPATTQSGWPELKLKPNPQQTTRILTPEELENHNWNQIQQRASKAAKDFFSRNGGSDDEESDEDEDEDDDMDEEDDDIKDKEYDFFWKLFNDDEELKGYYVKHCGGGGEFSCLVCGGVNEKHQKRLKKYKDCVALVQHSSSIAKTKKIRSHRAYGQVICKVLGWDINRLPSQIVTEIKSSELQVNDVDRASNLEADPNGKVHVSETVDGESMVCEDSLAVASVKEENTAKNSLNDTEASTVNTHEPVINNDAGSSKKADDVIFE